MVNLQADASLSVAAAGLTSGLPYVLPWFLDTTSQNLNVAELNVIGTAMRADVILETTATLTAEAIRNANVDSTLAVTTTLPTSDVTLTMRADAALPVVVAGIDTLTVAYDATGAGADSGASTVTSLSWSHTAAAGADVFAFIAKSTPICPTTVTYDGSAMALVGSLCLNNDGNSGVIYVYRKANVAGGTKTVSFTWSGANYASANSVSYTNVGSVTMSAAYGNTAVTATQTITGAAKSVILNAQTLNCGGTDTFSGSSGGTLRSQVLPSSKYMGLSIQDSTSTGSVAFTSTVTPSTTTWASLGMVLSPAPATGTALARTPTVLSIGGGNTGTTNTVMTWTHAIESTATLLVVAAPWVSGNFISTCTVNGVPMTKTVNWAYNVSGNTAAVDIFYLVNPPTGTQTITVTNVNGGATWWSGNSVTFSGAVAVGAATTVAQGSATPSSGSANDLFLNVIGTWVNNAGGVSGYNQTILWNGDGSTGGEPSLIGIARGPSPTFSLTNVMYSYGGYGNVALQIRGPIDRTADTSLTVTETQVPSRSTVNAPFVESIGAGGFNNAGWSHTVGSRANLLVVGINNAVYDAGPPTVYCDGVAMTQMTTWNYGYVYLNNYSYLTWYYLWNPTPGVHSITTSGAGSNGNSIAIGGAAGLGPPVISGSGTDTANTLPDQLMLNMFGGWPTGAGQEFTDYSPAAAVLWAPVATGGMPTVIGDWINETGSTTSFSATNHCGYGFGASILPIGNARYANSNLTITASTTATVAVNAVTWESTGAGGSANGGTITWTHTIGATANCVIVGVNTNTNPYNLPTVKVGSSTYLKCLGINYFDSPSGNNNYAMIFGLMNPPTGTQTFTVTGQSTFTSANSVAYNNVSGFDTPIYSNGSGTSMTLTDPGVDAGMVVSVFASRGPSVLTNYSQWTRHNFRDANTYPLLIGDAPGGVGLTFSATNSDTSNWGGIGLSLLPQSAAPTGIVYDGMGTSSSLTGYASISFSHVATANAFIILDICADRDNTLTNVQYAGQNMTLQGSVRFPGYSGNAGVWRYTLANAPGGLSTVTATLSVNSYFTAQTIGYTGVSSAAAPTTTFGTSSAPSQSVTCNPGQLIVQSIGSASATKIGIPTGGTNLIAANWSGESLVINQATASTTFAGSTSLSNWGAIASVLSRLSFTADSVLAITASPLAVGSLGQFANTTQAITATPTGIGVRNAMVDSTLAVTVSRTSNVTWALAANVAQTITASPTSIGSYGAVAAVTQAITANRPANVTWQLKANVTQPITTTITADSLRTAQVNATLPVTASPTSNVTWVLAANVAQTITATLQASELRLVNVDAALAVTAGYLGLDTVAYDSTGAGATGALGAAGTKTISWSHTIGPQANCVIVAGVALIGGATPNVSATCGATSMTNVGMVKNWDTSPGNYSTVFFMLKNPPTGIQTISFSSTDGTASYLVANSVAYRNVGSYEFLATNNGNGTSLTQGPLGSSASRMIVQAFSNNTTGVSITGYSQTQRWSQQGVANVNACMVIGDAPGAASVSFAASCATSAKWGAVALSLTPMPVAQVGIAADSAQTATASPTTTYLRNANVNATQQIIANRTGAIVVDLHGNATLPVTTTATGVGVRNAMVDSTIAVTASRTANSNWYAYADATQAITPRGLGLETVSPPTWVGTGPGKSQGTSPLTYTDTIPVGTTYTLLFGQLLCASATLPTVSATIGGVTATLVDSAYISSNSGNYLYGVCLALANPPTGSQTVSFTSNSILACAVNTVHYSGVGSLGPVSKIGQQAGQPSFSVGTDAKYGYAQAFFYAAAAAGNGFSSYNQNQRWTISAVLNVNGPLLIGDATGNGGMLTFSATRDNTTNSWGAMVVPLAPTSAGAIYGATAATALPITATRLANVTWAAKAAALQQITASPAAEYSRGQPASATQSITAIPDSTGSRGQTVDSTETITVSTEAIGSRGQGIDSPLVVAADLLSMVTWQGWFDAAQVITASDTANAIWALRANAAQQITASHTALASYGATGNALLPITASTTGHVIWDAHALSALIVTASTSTIGSRWQPIDSTQTITALPIGGGGRGQFVDSTLGLTITALPAAISYGATGNAPLVITANLLTSDTLLDNHAYAALVVNAGRPTSVIWDTRADSRLTVTTHFWATFGRLLNVDASLTVVTRLTAALRAVFLSNASLGIVAGLPTKLSRGQTSDSTQAIVMTPAGGIVWHGVIGAPLRITATLPGNAVWDAHANSQLIVTESGLVVPSRGQSIDPALEVTADASADYTQTMSGDVEQAILALPDTELSLGSTMDSALSLIVTYSADIGEALRGGNFFYFYL